MQSPAIRGPYFGSQSAFVENKCKYSLPQPVMIYFVFATGVSRLTLNCDESKLIAGDVNKAVKLKNLKLLESP